VSTLVVGGLALGFILPTSLWRMRADGGDLLNLHSGHLSLAVSVTGGCLV
jgi:hypothetical protein